jgi:hypothetical protein
MAPERLLPDDPLGFIKRCVKERRIYWTFHVNMRLKGRYIPRHAILESVESFEVIESYPADKYFPSYLIFSMHEGSVFHALFAVDVKGENVRMITTYRPDPEEWEADLKTRRRLP